MTTLFRQEWKVVDRATRQSQSVGYSYHPTNDESLMWDFFREFLLESDDDYVPVLYLVPVCVPQHQVSSLLTKTSQGFLQK